MNLTVAPVEIILLAVVALVAGLLGLKLIAIVFNAMIGHRRPHQMAHQGSSSGLVAGLAGGASILALVVGAGFLFYARSEVSVSHHHLQAERFRPETANAFHEAIQHLSDAREDLREAVHDATATIPVELANPPAADGTHGTYTTDEIQTAKESVPESKVSDSPGSTAPTTESPRNADSAAESTTVAEKPAVDPEMKARSAQLAQLATTIGQLVRSRLDQSGVKKPQDSSDPAGKTADSDVVVFQLSEELVQQLLGESGGKLLQSFNSELPESIRQTYALIPLTPPVGGAVSPVQPLLTASGLESIANSLVSLVDIAGPVAEPEPGERSSVVLTTAPELRPMPDWVKKPDGRRIVAETEPILPGDDAKKPLTGAINRALADHMASVTETVHPALRARAGRVRLELSEQTAQKCVVDTYERIEVIDTAEGQKTIRKMYALLEFPESVDNAAIHEIRRFAQRDRITGLGFVIGCTWLSIASAGFGIRLWRNGTRLRRWSSVPVFVAVSLPLLVVAAGSIVALSRGEASPPPWNQNTDAVRIDLLDAV